MSEKFQHLIAFQAENFKGLEAVKLEFDPAGGVFVVSGNNDAGKSSCLDALAAALGGSAYKPDMPVRAGADFAKVIAETEDLLISARWTEKSYKVVVENKADNSRHRSPQDVLNSFYSSFTIDPEEFTRLKNKEKAEVLRKLIGVDTAAMDAERARLHEERTGINREAKAYAAQLAGVKIVAAPKEEDILPEVSVVELSAKKSEAMTVNAENEKWRMLADSAKKEVDRARTAIYDQQRRIAALADECRKAKERHEAAVMEEVTLTRDLEVKVKVAYDAKAAAEIRLDINTPLIDSAMLDAATKNKTRQNLLFQMAEHKRSVAQQAAVQKMLTAKEQEAENITGAIASIDAKKHKLLTDAKLPVEGMELKDDAVFIKGVPFDQISSSEQIRIGIAVAVSMKPKLRLILVKHGDLLYDQKLKIVHEEALKNGILVITERASAAGNVGVVLSEGKVLGATDV